MMSEPEGSTLVAGMRKQTGDYYYQAINLTGVLREKKLVPEREVLEVLTFITEVSRVFQFAFFKHLT